MLSVGGVVVEEEAHGDCGDAGETPLPNLREPWPTPTPPLPTGDMGAEEVLGRVGGPTFPATGEVQVGGRGGATPGLVGGGWPLPPDTKPGFDDDGPLLCAAWPGDAAAAGAGVDFGSTGGGGCLCGVTAAEGGGGGGGPAVGLGAVGGAADTFWCPLEGGKGGARDSWNCGGGGRTSSQGGAGAFSEGGCSKTWPSGVPREALCVMVAYSSEFISCCCCC